MPRRLGLQRVPDDKVHLWLRSAGLSLHVSRPRECSKYLPARPSPPAKTCQHGGRSKWPCLFSEATLPKPSEFYKMPHANAVASSGVLNSKLALISWCFGFSHWTNQARLDKDSQLQACSDDGQVFQGSHYHFRDSKAGQLECEEQSQHGRTSPSEQKQR